MRLAVCRLCRTPILMARHKHTQKPAPIEVQPSDDGNILLCGDVYEVVPLAERDKVKLRGFVLRKNHFATCVFAKSFAKPKASPKAKARETVCPS